MFDKFSFWVVRRCKGWVNFQLFQSRWGCYATLFAIVLFFLSIATSILSLSGGRVMTLISPQVIISSICIFIAFMFLVVLIVLVIHFHRHPPRDSTAEDIKEIKDILKQQMIIRRVSRRR